MLDIFLYSANALLPITILTALGFFLRRANIVDWHFLKSGNTLIFRLFVPVLVFYSIYKADDLTNVNWRLIFFIIFAIITLFLLGLVIVKLFVKDPKCKGVIVQAVFRSNYSIIGLPLVEALSVAGGLSLAALLSAVVIPTFNILAVIALTVFIRKEHGIKNIFKEIAKNPLIIASVLGIAVLLVRQFLLTNSDGELIFSLSRDLPFITKSLSFIADSTSALSLIVLGGMLDFKAVKGKSGTITLGVFCRLVFAPAVGISLALLMKKLGIISFLPADFAALIAIFASPIAFASAVMAEEMGSDGDVARQIVAWTSALDIFTLFIIISLFRYFSLI